MLRDRARHKKTPNAAHVATIRGVKEAVHLRRTLCSGGVLCCEPLPSQTAPKNTTDRLTIGTQNLIKFETNILHVFLLGVFCL